MTLGGGRGFEEVSHILFCFLTYCFNCFCKENYLLQSKIWLQKTITFYLKTYKLKNQSSRIEKCYTGGEVKYEKIVKYYLNGPLRDPQISYRCRDCLLSSKSLILTHYDKKPDL